MTQVATNNLSVIANRLELIDCLSAVIPACKQNGPHEILKCVRITATPKGIQFEATDHAIRIRSIANEVQVESQGEVCVSGFDLLRWVGLIDDEIIHISVEGEKLTAKAASGLRSLPTQKASEFPPDVVEEDEIARFVMPIEALRTSVNFVEHAIAKKVASRFTLEGILFERVSSTAAVLVATTGRIMAAIGITGDFTGKEPNIIVPGKFITTAIKTLPEGDGEVIVGVSKSRIRVQYGDLTAWSLRLEGHFAPWRSEITADQTIGAKVPRADFLAAVRQAGDSYTEMQTGMELKISASGIAMQQTTPERGTSAANFPCQVTGGEMRWACNSKMLIEALRNMDGDEIELGWSSPKKTVKITCGAMTEVISPVNLPE